MARIETLIAADSTARLNVADRLNAAAQANPRQLAAVCPQRPWTNYFSRNKRAGVNRATGAPDGPRPHSGTTYQTITFADLDADVSGIARGLANWGVPPGTRLALLVRPGIDFVAIVFALLRAGLVIVMVDPGMGRRNLIRCLAEANPEGFVAIGAAQAVRSILRRRFSNARWNVTVGRRWFWGGKTLDELRTEAKNPQSAIRNPQSANTRPDDPAAIIFTSGSTGAPKGVLYTHRMFDTQVAEIQAQYDIERGGVDMACFPLFALFNAAMGVTTVMPKMDFSRPATAKPRNLLAAANDWQVTQAFASPAVWRLLGKYCHKTGDRVNSLRQVFSCGAPVPADVLQATLGFVGADAKMHTPYGATECLPVSTIEAMEILRDTAYSTNQGAGVCVGRKFESIDWRVIQISDEPIASIEDAEKIPTGEIGELIVCGSQVSPRYVTRFEANALAKIADGDRFWHRTGDVGYFDKLGRFWYCGRKAHRVETDHGPLFTECVEGIFSTHPEVKRSALIAVGSIGDQIPVICILPVKPIRNRTSMFHGWQPEQIAAEAQRLGRNRPAIKAIQVAVYLPAFPVDVRHNAKILRELLHDWACRAIIDDGDLYPRELVQRVLECPSKLKSPPPFAAFR